jgi:hypothetical protein
MGSARRKQGDLFDEERVTELRPELRSRLTPLLQALLTEAARLRARQQTQSSGLGESEQVDDQDHR